MAGAASKKSTHPLRFTLAADHAKSPSPELSVGIAEVFRLEGDYVLVKVGHRCGSRRRAHQWRQAALGHGVA